MLIGVYRRCGTAYLSWTVDKNYQNTLRNISNMRNPHLLHSIRFPDELPYVLLGCQSGISVAPVQFRSPAPLFLLTGVNTNKHSQKCSPKKQCSCVVSWKSVNCFNIWNGWHTGKQKYTQTGTFQELFGPPGRISKNGPCSNHSVIFGFFKYSVHNTQSPNKAPSWIYSFVKRFRKRDSEVPFCTRNDLQQQPTLNYI
jgi:hypothetical protein